MAKHICEGCQHEFDTKETTAEDIDRFCSVSCEEEVLEAEENDDDLEDDSDEDLEDDEDDDHDGDD